MIRDETRPIGKSSDAFLKFALEFQYLSDLDIELDLTITGIELPEIDIALQSLSLDDDREEDPADTVPDLCEGPSVTQAGDVWHIGPHRLVCGDSTRKETYTSLLGKLSDISTCGPDWGICITEGFWLI